MESIHSSFEISSAHAAMSNGRSVSLQGSITAAGGAETSEKTSIPLKVSNIPKKKSLCLLMDFPSVKLAAIIVGEWLDIWDLGRLDSAVCNHEQQLRTKYLKFFGPTSMISMTSSSHGLRNLLCVENAANIGTMERSRVIQSSECFRFLQKRNAALTTLALTLFADKRTLHEYLTHFGHKLLVLELYGHLNSLNTWQLYFELFSHLPRLQVFHMHPQSSAICAQDVLDITQSCAHLKILHLHNKFHLLPPPAKVIGKEYPKVQPNLAVYYSNTNTTATTATMDSKLTSFLLRSYAKSTQFCLTSLSQCALLTTLDLEGCVGLNDTALLKIANSNITHYNLNYCTKLTATGLLAFFTANSAKNAHINVLKFNKVEVSDDLLVCIGSQCTALTILSMKLCKTYTDVGLSAIAQCVLLTELYVQMNDNITDESVESLTTHCTQLHTLTLNNCAKLTDTTLTNIVTLPLHTLHISGRSGITEAGFMQALQHTTFAGTITNLDVSDIPTLTDTSLKCIAQACVSLQVLNISGLSAVIDTSIVDIATYCTTLHTLYMCELIYIIDSSVHTLCALPLLHTLHLADCAKLTDDSVVMLAMQGNKRFVSLRLRGIESLTDMAGTCF